MPFQSSPVCDTVGGIKLPCRLIFLLKLSSFLFLILKFLANDCSSPEKSSKRKSGNFFSLYFFTDNSVDLCG
jgi:hypothetical protein